MKPRRCRPGFIQDLETDLTKLEPTKLKPTKLEPTKLKATPAPLDSTATPLDAELVHVVFLREDFVWSHTSGDRWR